MAANSRTTLVFLLAGLAGVVSGWFGIRQSSLAPVSGRIDMTEIVGGALMRNGALLVANPYTCALRSEHLTRLAASASELGLEVRYAIPGQELTETQVALFQQDFNTDLVPQTIDAATLNSLFGEGPIAFPALVVFRRGRVVASVQAPITQRLLGNIRVLYGG
jgi:hypothetical protein